MKFLFFLEVCFCRCKYVSSDKVYVDATYCVGRSIHDETNFCPDKVFANAKVYFYQRGYTDNYADAKKCVRITFLNVFRICPDVLLRQKK